MANDHWQIFAVRYAHHERMGRENFLIGDPHDDSPMPLDYFVWGLVSEKRFIVVDTGFDQTDGAAARPDAFEVTGRRVEGNWYQSGQR